ncbi:MAG TPA: response regulator [Pyrinomonadaceae bacterium]|jgi:CheY-like chemotaxis protein
MAKILIVEDHPDTRELLRLMLEMDGYEIAEARDGEEGVRKAHEAVPNLILMDISLAGEISGWEATQRLRADSKFDDTIIVALTAHAMKDDRDTTFAYGCDEYWTKPILDFPEFQRSIREMVALGRRSLVKNDSTNS